MWCELCPLMQVTLTETISNHYATDKVAETLAKAALVATDTCTPHPSSETCHQCVYLHRSLVAQHPIVENMCLKGILCIRGGGGGGQYGAIFEQF